MENLSAVKTHQIWEIVPTFKRPNPQQSWQFSSEKLVNHLVLKTQDLVYLFLFQPLASNIETLTSITDTLIYYRRLAILDFRYVWIKHYINEKNTLPSGKYFQHIDYHLVISPRSLLNIIAIYSRSRV